MMKEVDNLMKGSVHEDDLFIVHDSLVLMTEEGDNQMDVCNSPNFMPSDNSLNRDILHSLRFHCVLSRFLLDREGTDDEERNMRFSLSTPK